MNPYHVTSTTKAILVHVALTALTMISLFLAFLYYQLAEKYIDARTLPMLEQVQIDTLSQIIEQKQIIVQLEGVEYVFSGYAVPPAEEQSE